MKQVVSKGQFMDAFRDMGRGDQFTYEGLSALYDHIRDIEDEIGEDSELDVVGLCCDFTEYSNYDEVAREYFEYDGMEYGDDGEELLSVEEVEEKAKKFIESKDLNIIPLENGGVIIQNM